MGKQASATVPLDLLENFAAEKADAFLGGFGVIEAAKVHVEARQHLLAPVDDGSVDAEAGEDAGELDRDIAAAPNQDLVRELFEVEGLVGRDAELVAFERGMRARPRTGCDQDVLGGDGSSV